MAIFHFTVKIVGRSKGKSVISASAYLNGDVMKNEETGRISYYTSKKEVVYTSLMMCENAPPEWLHVPEENIKRFQQSIRYKRADDKDAALEKFKITFQKQRLWNEVLKIEKNADAQLGRSFEFSLPKEWSRQEQIDYTTEYIQKTFVDEGMCADWSIHDKGDGNPHVHLLVTMRPFNPDHSWGNKEVKDWADANGTTADAYTGFLPLQTLNKVFMYNNTGSKTYDNCWDFVAEGEHGLYMDIDSEIVGKNFLYMLTEDTYAGWLKEAFDALSADEQAYFQPTIDAMASEASDLGLGENGKYALAWIKLWVESYNAQTDDGPICNTLVDKSATDQFGLLVYSKLRSVEESATVSVNNVNVAAYQDGYTGIGGFGYCHYLFVTDNSPLPWTACAFIAYMTCTEDGFSAWGKDMGGYSSNPTVAEAIEATYGHQKGGYVDGVDTFPAKDDHGYEWWTNQGKLVLEDPEYCSSVAFTVGSWIELLTKYSAG